MPGSTTSRTGTGPAAKISTAQRNAAGVGRASSVEPARPDEGGHEERPSAQKHDHLHRRRVTDATAGRRPRAAARAAARARSCRRRRGSSRRRPARSCAPRAAAAAAAQAPSELLEQRRQRGRERAERVVDPPERPVGLGDRVSRRPHLERGDAGERRGAQDAEALHRLDLAPARPADARRVVPIGRTRASGSARRAAASEPAIGGHARAGSQRGSSRVAVDRLGAEHELGRVEASARRRSRRAGARVGRRSASARAVAAPPRPGRRRRRASRRRLRRPSSAWVAATTRITAPPYPDVGVARSQSGRRATRGSRTSTDRLEPR